MRANLRYLSTTLVLLTVVLAGSLPVLGAPISKRARAVLLQRVLPAWQTGEVRTVVAELSNLIQARSTEEIIPLDEWMLDLGLRPVKETLLRGRLFLVETGAAAGLPKPGATERSFLLESLREETVAARRAIDQHPALRQDLPPPDSLLEYEHLLPDLQRFDERLVQHIRLAEFGHALSESASHPVSTLSEDSLPQIDFVSSRAEFIAVRENLRRRDIELRVQRMKVATKTLATGHDLATRLLAAWAVQTDAQALKHRDPQLGATVDELASTARSHASPELFARAESLFTGLNWWMRGRYGHGPMGSGLLKYPAAMASTSAQHAIYMPAESPQPTDPTSGGEPIPFHQRRHHHIWQWEYRYVNPIGRWYERTETKTEQTRIDLEQPIVIGRGKPCPRVYTEVETGESSTEQLRATFKSISPYHDEMAYRLVGFTEYGQALYHLDKFSAGLAVAELESINRLLAQLPQFAVYTNLSRLVPHDPSPLDELGTQQQDDFRRTGLEWVLAVARVEHGAIMAAFTRRQQPFGVRHGNAVDREAYAELLLDGVRTHMWAMQRDPRLTKQLRTGSNVTQCLSYSRRIRMVYHMLVALAELSNGEYGPSQVAQLRHWRDSLEQQQVILAARVEQALAGATMVVRHSQSRAFGPSEQVRSAAMAELAAGRATASRNRSREVKESSDRLSRPSK